MTFLEAVNSLGKTPKNVTQVLREKGIKGYRNCKLACPIARYLNACGFSYVTVAGSANHYRDDSEAELVQSFCLPMGVQAWIADFDMGRCPEFDLTYKGKK